MPRENIETDLKIIKFIDSSWLMQFEATIDPLEQWFIALKWPTNLQSATRLQQDFDQCILGAILLPKYLKI